MKTPKYLQLDLENCEIRVIDFKDIGDLRMDHIYDLYHYFDNVGQQITIHRRVIGDLTLILKKSADKDGLFNRLLAYPDICSITFLDKDLKEIEDFFVEWSDKDASGCNNRLQHAKRGSEGYDKSVLEVTIGGK